MANIPPYGSSGAPHLSYSASNSDSAQRRSSYASVAAGNTGSYSQNLLATSRPGVFSHLASPNPPSSLYTQSGSTRPSHHASGSDTLMDDGISVPGSWGRGGIGNYSSQYGFGQVHNMSGAGSSANGNGFFVPSYLRGSRYIEKFQAAHEAKLAAQRGAPATHPSGTGALSSRSSSVSLPKLAPSHRGMTYEVIEHQPPEIHDGWSPLPSKWAETDKNQAMAIGDDGLEVHFVGGSKLHDNEAAATRTDYPMPVEGGIYYYEVRIDSKGKDG
ncbi:MAG: hypothetical protein Q9201_006245 [Fulgogasparrea decipioides]